jgi:hypothetical protein
MYTTKEIETIRNDFENRGIAIKEIYTEGNELVIKWANPEKTGKQESRYIKMAA